ncbi:MAG: right-handed parallel beta-helix repeat-containing protein, partial [Methanobacteriaceae archaeon]
MVFSNNGLNLAFLGFALLLLLFVVPCSFSADVPVSGTDFSDIQSAIDSAGSGDIVKLGNISYSGSQIRVNKSNIVIEGPSSSKGATLDPKNSGRIFYINGTNITIRYITFKNANSGTSGGSAISFREGSNLIVNDCTFINNEGESGGAFFSMGGTDDFLINNSRFINNHGSYIGDDDWTEGGAVDSHSTNTKIYNCVFDGNSALTIGGAVSIKENNAFIVNCSFTNNQAPSGGAIYWTGAIDSNNYILNCNFTGNDANASVGGAIRSSGSYLKITNSKFVSNTAVSNGAGIYLSYSSFTNIIDSCNFTSNVASNGGGVYVSGDVSSLTVLDSIFISNSASSSTTTASAISSLSKTIVSFCDFKNNVDIVVRLSSDDVQVLNSNFSSSNDYAIRIIGNNALITDNILNKTYGILVTGNNTRVNSNKIVNTSNYSPLSVTGNDTQINSNIINGSSLGVSIIGNGLKFINNNISDISSAYALAVTGVNSEISGNDIISCNRGVSVSGNGLVFKDNFVSKIIGAYAVNIV